MAVLVDTRVHPPADRFDCWHEAASKIFFPLSVERTEHAPFFGRVTGHGLGPLRVFRIEGDANTCLRTPRGIAASDPEDLQLHVVRRGRFRFAQDGRSDELRPGDLCAQDTSRPYTIDIRESFQLVVVDFPKYLLGPHADRITGRTAQRVPGDSGLGARVAPFLTGLVDGLDDGSVGGADAYLADSLVGLLRSLFHDGDAATAGERLGPALTDRIRAHIEAHLHEPGLGPEQIAAAHFISVRYLHKLFRNEETTVSRWIQQRRLDRCRRDLGDPARAGRTIEAIAASWGLTNPDHFSRLCRATYGCSPRELRRRLLG